ncbi:MAG: response regulator [Deltaproteobacteria bacterium]|nr:response regulator [Deltaproteobacteria bacterium]
MSSTVDRNNAGVNAPSPDQKPPKEKNSTKPPAKVLIVDDAQSIRKLLTNILIKNGYEAQTAPDGLSALQSIAKDPPDIILLDIIMPVMDGYEVCRLLKSDEKSCMIPVIFISALDEETDKMDGFNAGGADYITKPFQIPELLARVQVHLELERLQRELKKKNDELQRYAQRLEELNVALKVLLVKKEEDTLELEEKISLNIKRLLLPNVELLKKRIKDKECHVLLDMIELNLKEITSTFSQKLSSKFIGLTPTEIKVANLVKEGKQIKEIAEILSVSRYAVELHRFNIRKKLGLKSRKINLQSYLASIS